MFSIAASNSILNLQGTQKKIDNILEQVQTGKRINKSADDASGMTIANNLNMQANGLQQGTKNANDAKSLLNIADGAITSFKETIGLMKDKSISAASDASSADSRMALQRDISKLMQSLDNIANTTSFNGINLLNGTFTNKSFQVGAFSGQTVNVSLGSLNTNKIGHLTESETTVGVSAGTTAATLKINGTTINQVTTSNTTKDGANLVAEAINAKRQETGVRAVAETTVNGGSVVSGALADGDLSINGFSIGAVNVNANDSTATLADSINAISGKTGVTARIDAGSLVLESMNGENIHITEANGGAAKAGLVAGENYGKVRLTSNDGISIENATDVSGFDAVTTNNYTLSDLDVTSMDGAQRAMEILDAALQESNQNASTVGSTVNQLDRIININNITETNVRAAESTIMSANIEELTKELSDLQVKNQAGMFSLQKANEIQQGVLGLLR